MFNINQINVQGMFAFVVATDDGSFMACRDKIGIKPLYMGKTRNGNAILFSSELKSIIDLCDPKDLQTFPAGHFWTPETGLVRYYKVRYLPLLQKFLTYI